MGEPVRTRKSKLAGRGKHDTRLGRVTSGASQKKVQRKSARLSSAGKKSSTTMIIGNGIEKGEKKKEWEQKECTSRAVRTIQVMVEARQHQNGNTSGSRFMLSSQRSHCHDSQQDKFGHC